MKNDMAYILFTEEQIQARVKEMGAAITEKYNPSPNHGIENFNSFSMIILRLYNLFQGPIGVLAYSIKLAASSGPITLMLSCSFCEKFLVVNTQSDIDISASLFSSNPTRYSMQSLANQLSPSASIIYSPVDLSNP